MLSMTRNEAIPYDAMKTGLAEANRANCDALAHPTRGMVWI
jgi:hypothetical protein